MEKKGLVKGFVECNNGAENGGEKDERFQNEFGRIKQWMVAETEKYSRSIVVY